MKHQSQFGSLLSRFRPPQKESREDVDGEYGAEQLESRILYSAAPAPTEVSLTEDAAPEAETPGFEGTANFGGVSKIQSGSEIITGEQWAGDSVTLASLDHLTEEEFANLTDAARQRWQATGLSEEQVSALSQIEYEIVDFSGDILGATDGYVIEIDLDAAGEGWFIDTTPFDDAEFGTRNSLTALRATEGDALYGMDLLSVLMHEQGHVLGLEDIYDSMNDSVMFGAFTEGERRIAADNEASNAIAGSLEGVHYAVASSFAVTDNTDSLSSSNVRISNHSTDADTDILIVGVAAWQTGTGADETVTFNGTTLTAVPGSLSSDINTNNRRMSTQFFYLENPGAVTGDIVATLPSGGYLYRNIVAYNLEDVVGGIGGITALTDTTDTGGTEVSVSHTAGQDVLVIDLLVSDDATNNSATNTANSGQNVILSTRYSGAMDRFTGSSFKAVPGGNVTMGWTFGQANIDPEGSAYTALVITGTLPAAAGEINLRDSDGDSIANRSAASTTLNTDFGSVDEQSASITRTFTIANTDGTNPIDLMGTPLVSISGSSDFTISAQPATDPIGAGGTTTFDVTFDPTLLGTQTATVSIFNDDADEAVFTFEVRGEVNSLAGDFKASAIAYDPIRTGSIPANGDYAMTSLTGQNPSVPGFTDAWAGSTATWKIDATGLEHDSIIGEFGGATVFNHPSDFGSDRTAQRDLTSPPANTETAIWTAGLVQLQGTHNNNGYAYGGFGQGNWGFNGPIIAETQGLLFGVEGDGTNMDLVFRHRASDGTMTSRVLQDGIIPGETHLVIMRLTPNSGGDDTVEIWIDPDGPANETMLGTPTATFTDHSLGDLSTTFTDLMLGANSALYEGVAFDEMAIGTRLEDVVTVDRGTTPVIAADATVTHTEGTGATVISPGLTLTDDGGPVPAAFSAAATITDGFVNGEDVLAVNAGLSTNLQSSVSGDGRTVTFTAVNSGATVADFQAAMRLVTFEHTGNDPDGSAARTVRFTFNDGFGNVGEFQSLASWDFNDGDRAVDGQGGDLIIGDITAGAGTSVFAVSQPTSPAPGYSSNILRISPAAARTDTAAAIAGDTYFEFVVGANGQTYSLENLSFDLARGGSNGTRGYAVFASTDGFATAPVPGDALAAEANMDTAFSRPNQTSIQVDLSAASLQGLTADTTFRVYIHTPATNNEMDFDNLVLNGSIGGSPTTEVTISPTNDAPVPVADNASATEDGDTIYIAVLGNDTDPEGDNLAIDPTSLTISASGAAVSLRGEATAITNVNVTGDGSNNLLLDDLTVTQDGQDVTYTAAELVGITQIDFFKGTHGSSNVLGPQGVGTPPAVNSRSDFAEDDNFATGLINAAGDTDVFGQTVRFDEAVSSVLFFELGGNDNVNVQVSSDGVDWTPTTTFSTSRYVSAGFNTAYELFGTGTVNSLADLEAVTLGAAGGANSAVVDGMVFGASEFGVGSFTYMRFGGAGTGVDPLLIKGIAPQVAYTPTSAQLDTIAAGDTLNDTFTYKVTDENGGEATQTVTVAVTGVNDAPTGGDVTLETIAKNDGNPAGNVLSSLFTGSAFVDDTGDTFEGVAVTGNAASSGEGTYQYSTDGSTWSDISTTGLTDATALMLGSSVQIRFLPATDFEGDPGSLTVRVLDGNYGPITTGSTADVTTHGGQTAIAANTSAIDVTVTSFTTDEDTPLLISGFTDIRAIDGTAISPGQTIALSGMDGAVTLNLDGTLTYDPTIDLNGLNDGESRGVSFSVTTGLSTSFSGIAEDSFVTTSDGSGGTYDDINNVNGQDPTVGLTGLSGPWVGGNTAIFQADGTTGLTHNLLNEEEGQSIRVRSGYDRFLDRPADSLTPSSQYFMSALFRTDGSTFTENFSVGFGADADANAGSRATGFYTGFSGTSLVAYAGNQTFEILATPVANTTYAVVLQLDVDAGGNESLSAWYAADGDAAFTLAFAGQSVETFASPTDLGYLKLESDGPNSNTPDDQHHWQLDEVRLATSLNDLGINTRQTSTMDIVVTGISDTSATAPIADITSLSPDPRNTDAGTVNIVFSEDVTGVTIDDFILTRDGANVDISALSVSSSDAQNYSIDLSPVTGVDGAYTLRLVASGSGIQDLSAEVLQADALETWSADLTAPTVVISAFSPDPRNTPVGTATITFSENVSGVDITDFTLTRDSTPVDISGLPVQSIDAKRYTLDLGGVTSAEGTYELTLFGNATIQDVVTNALATNTVESWTTDTTAPVLQSFVRQTPSAQITNADTLVFRATFDEDVVNVTTGDFVVTGTTGTISAVSAAAGANVYDITVSGGDLAEVNGTIGLNLAGGQNIKDPAGNALPSGEPSTADETYIVNNGPAFDDAIVLVDSGVTGVIHTISAVDLDDDTVNYSISGGADATLFDIDPVSGEISFKTPPDAANPGDIGSDNVYNFNVRATNIDNGTTPTRDRTVTVQVSANSYQTNEDTTVNVAVSGTPSHIDGTAITDGGPAVPIAGGNGSISLSGGALTYDPTVDHNGLTAGESIDVNFTVTRTGPTTPVQDFPSNFGEFNTDGSNQVRLTGTVVSGNANQLLVVSIAAEDAQASDPDTSVTSVTFGGQILTQVAESTGDADGRLGGSWIWVLNDAGIAAATGTDIVVTFDNAMNVSGEGVIVGATIFSNVDQTTPVGPNTGTFYDGGNPTGASVTFDTVSNNSLLFGSMMFGGPTGASNVTTTADVLYHGDVNSDPQGSALTLAAPTAGTQTLSLSYPSSSFRAALAAIEINGATETTIGIAVNGVNDSPNFHFNDGTSDVDEIVVLEDANNTDDNASYTYNNFVVVDDPGASTGNESGQSISGFTIVNNTAPALFQTIDIADGNLTFTTASDAHGFADITVRVTDNGAEDRPTGNNASYDDLTFRITVEPVNDAAGFQLGYDDNTSTLDDTFAIPGFQDLINNLINNGAITDASAIVITDLPKASDGVLYEADTPSNRAVVADDVFVVDDLGNLLFVPNTAAGNTWNGTTRFEYHVRQSDGTLTPGPTIDDPGYIYAVGLAVKLPLREQANVTVDQDTGIVSLSNFAQVDPGDVSPDNLFFESTSPKPGLFSNGPSLGMNGTLNFTTAPGASGTSVVTLNLTDGVTSYGTQSFLITLNEVTSSGGGNTGEGFSGITIVGGGGSGSSSTFDLTRPVTRSSVFDLFGRDIHIGLRPGGDDSVVLGFSGSGSSFDPQAVVNALIGGSTRAGGSVVLFNDPDDFRRELDAIVNGDHSITYRIFDVDRLDGSNHPVKKNNSERAHPDGEGNTERDEFVIPEKLPDNGLISPENADDSPPPVESAEPVGLKERDTDSSRKPPHDS